MSAPKLRHPIRFIILFVLIVISASSFCYSIETTDEALNAARKGRAEFFAEAYLQRGRKDLERGDYLRAIRVLSAAISKGAGPEAYKWRGQAYDAAGNYEKALQDLGQYLGANPSDPIGYVFRGDAYAFRHEFPQALADYNKALQLDPSCIDALMGRGSAYMGLERHEEAIRDFRAVLKHQPGNQEALQNLGTAYMLSQRPAKALEFFRKGVEAEAVPKWKIRLATLIDKAQQDAQLQDAGGGLRYDHTPSELIEDQPHYEAKSPEALPSAETTGAESSEAERAEGRGGHKKRFESTLDRLLASKKPSEGRASAAYEGLGSSHKGITGDWDATYMGTRVRLSVYQQVGKRVSGALRITMRGGAEEDYPFSGTFDRGNIRVSHRDGHTFRGTLGADGRLIGVLRMRNGQEISVNLAKH
jgi:tetratricopeptide (TPR) repeat protein